MFKYCKIGKNRGRDRDRKEKRMKRRCKEKTEKTLNNECSECLNDEAGRRKGEERIGKGERQKWKKRMKNEDQV